MAHLQQLIDIQKTIEEYNLKLPNIQDYFDSYMLEIA